MKLTLRRHAVATALVAATALTGSLLAATPAAEAATTSTTVSPSDTPDNPINGFRNVGYFAQWGIYGRNYQVGDIEKAGNAGKLNVINYAFANISQDGQCFEANKAVGTGGTADDGVGSGDAYADYGKSYDAATSVSGTADAWDQPLAGNFNQLKELKAKNPNLKVVLSIGGWSYSKFWSKVAASDASRKKFVSSCVDMFLKGNLPVIDGRGGTGAGAGVFDGFDIDWEWPGTDNGLTGNIVDPANDGKNFVLLAKEFRSQLDALTTTTGEKYILSAFAPANPEDITTGHWNDPELFKAMDYVNVQGYDLWGAWNPTLDGHQINLYDDPADPRDADQQFSADKAISLYTSAGINPAQLGLGMAMYGRGWTGVKSSTPWSAATGAAHGTYEDGIEDYDKIKSVGTGSYDATVGAAWRYDGTNWWSLDTAQTVAQKADYIRKKGLGGGMWWELDGDRDGDLLTALMSKLGTGAAGPLTGSGTTQPTSPTTTAPTTTTPTTTAPTTPGTTSPTTPSTCSAAAWSASTVYTGGQTVSYQGTVYTAQWWTQGDTPGASGSSPWKATGSCGTATTTSTASTTPTGTATTSTPTGTATTGTGTCSAAAWSASTVYTGGQTVSYQGSLYTAQWWTQGDTPGASQWGPWALKGTC
jgi:chitinase